MQILVDSITAYKGASIVVPVQDAGTTGTASIDGVPLLVISWTDTQIILDSSDLQLGAHELLIVCENGNGTVDLQILNNNKRRIRPTGHRFGFGF